MYQKRRKHVKSKQNSWLKRKTSTFLFLWFSSIKNLFSMITIDSNKLDNKSQIWNKNQCEYLMQKKAMFHTNNTVNRINKMAIRSSSMETLIFFFIRERTYECFLDFGCCCAKLKSSNECHNTHFLIWIQFFRQDLLELIENSCSSICWVTLLVEKMFHIGNIYGRSICL